MVNFRLSVDNINISSMSCNEGNPPRIFFWQEGTTFSDPDSEGDTMEMPRLETVVSKNPQPSLSAVATTSFFKECPPTETQCESNGVTQCTGAYWNGEEFILDAHKGNLFYLE